MLSELIGQTNHFDKCRPNPIINLKNTFPNRPSDRAQIVHACADRDENGSHLKKNRTHPPQSNTKPIRIEGRPSAVSRQPSDGRQTEGVNKSAMRMRRFASIASRRLLRFAFWGNVTLSTSTHRHYDESVHRIKQLTIPYNRLY